MSIAENMHPHPDFLRGLPTLRVQTPADDGEDWQALCRKQGIDYVLELKLETAHCRYWLIAKYVAQSGSGFEGWQAGHVVRESLEPDEHGEHNMCPYGPDEVKLLQGMEYLNALKRERQRLEQDGGTQPKTWEEVRSYDAICKEVESVVKSFPRE
jgi:hypothetical protein